MNRINPRRPRRKISPTGSDRAIRWGCGKKGLQEKAGFQRLEEVSTADMNGLYIGM